MSSVDGNVSFGPGITFRSTKIDSNGEVEGPPQEAKASITKAEDAIDIYRPVLDESDDVQKFLNAFSHNNHIYGLINTLNNNLKSVFREMRESETSIRIKKYIDQFDTALAKRDEIIEAAEEVKNLRFQAADLKMGMGIMSGVMGVASLAGGGSGGAGSGQHFAAAVQKNLEAKIDRLNAEAEELQALLQARQVELDAEMNIDKQDGELANAHIALVDNLTSTFSSMINELHSHHSSTINALSKSIV
ncbi:hypothetical protein [Microbulbifer sp. JTAC008]|uniref:hypothetical protein n=1 Tax=unclassified Microbulbifer TaxID=2619833 RepID=UPI00403947D2